MFRHHRGKVPHGSIYDNLKRVCVCLSVCVDFVTPGVEPDILGRNPGCTTYHLGDLK